MPGRWFAARSRIDLLTTRERQIFGMVGSGACNRDISRNLEITERTVKLHLSNILRKLGLTSRLEVGLAAAEDELLRDLTKGSVALEHSEG